MTEMTRLSLCKQKSHHGIGATDGWTDAWRPLEARMADWKTECLLLAAKAPHKSCLRSGQYPDSSQNSKKTLACSCPLSIYLWLVQEDRIVI